MKTSARIWTNFTVYHKPACTRRMRSCHGYTAGICHPLMQSKCFLGLSATFCALILKSIWINAERIRFLPIRGFWARVSANLRSIGGWQSDQRHLDMAVSVCYFPWSTLSKTHPNHYTSTQAVFKWAQVEFAIVTHWHAAQSHLIKKTDARLIPSSSQNIMIYVHYNS